MLSPCINFIIELAGHLPPLPSLPLLLPDVAVLLPLLVIVMQASVLRHTIIVLVLQE